MFKQLASELGGTKFTGYEGRGTSGEGTLLGSLSEVEHALAAGGDTYLSDVLKACGAVNLLDSSHAFGEFRKRGSSSDLGLKAGEHNHERSRCGNEIQR